MIVPMAFLILLHLSVLVAMDINPAQNSLLELKIAAIQYLTYEEYLLVLGEKEDTQQRRYYKR